MYRVGNQTFNTIQEARAYDYATNGTIDNVQSAATPATRNITMPDGRTMSVRADDPRLQGLSDAEAAQKILGNSTVTDMTATKTGANVGTATSSATPGTSDSILDDLLGIGGSAAAFGLLKTAYDNLGGLGSNAQDFAETLAAQQMQQAQFQPYTITTATGGEFGTEITPVQRTYTDPVTGETKSITEQQLSTTMELSPEELAIQRGLLGRAGRMFGPTPGAAQLQQAGLGALGRGQQLMATPTFGIDPTRAAAEQAFGLGGRFMTAAEGQPADINLLRGQFAGQVPGLLTQEPSAGIGSLGQQALGLGTGQLGQGVTDVTQTFAGIRPPEVRTGAGALAARGLGLGMAGLDTTAPADVEALRGQYGGLAGQAAADVLRPTGAREAEVFERIRATQRPEEERQRLALEERLAAQGRLGVRSAAFGGATPEQLALATAQEEAQDRASLSAIQQAQAERQRALGEAQAFGGMFTQQAGLSSQLQSQAQQRAAQLSQLGLSADQVQSQMNAEGFGRQMQLAGAGLQAQQAQSALESQSQQRATQLAQLGLSAEQIQSQLQSEGLGRATTAAGQTAQLAQLAGGLQAQQAGLGAQYAGLGANLAQQRQALNTARQAQALQAMQAGQGLLGGELGLQSARQQLGLTALGGAYLPQTQLLRALAPGQTAAAAAQQAQLYGTGLFGEATASGIDALLAAELGRGQLIGTAGSGLLAGLVEPGGILQNLIP